MLTPEDWRTSENAWTWRLTRSSARLTWLQRRHRRHSGIAQHCTALQVKVSWQFVILFEATSDSRYSKPLIRGRWSDVHFYGG